MGTSGGHFYHFETDELLWKWQTPSADYRASLCCANFPVDKTISLEYPWFLVLFCFVFWMQVITTLTCRQIRFHRLWKYVSWMFQHEPKHYVHFCVNVYSLYISNVSTQYFQLYFNCWLLSNLEKKWNAILKENQAGTKMSVNPLAMTHSPALVFLTKLREPHSRQIWSNLPFLLLSGDLASSVVFGLNSETLNNSYTKRMSQLYLNILEITTLSLS